MKFGSIGLMGFLGFGVWGLGFRVGVLNLGFVWLVGFGVLGFECRVQGFMGLIGFTLKVRVWNLVYRVYGV